MDTGLGRRNKAVARHKHSRRRAVVRPRRLRSKAAVRRVRVAILLARRLGMKEGAHPGRRPRKAVAVPLAHPLERKRSVRQDRRPARAEDIRLGHRRPAVATPGRQRLQDMATRARITDRVAL
ncbi:hypothetical protein PPGU16_15630 [Paraburkholderia largidicola]|uniref:Uncharacterized protein n=1 Tax=Paraburkholderia largidicola TaxID=3014751 RepID=A0A7I8BIL3_9BURK|nr:hypothetical protein PPGU16_15630 [Paraburkholderia sp. PGU16]